MEVTQGKKEGTQGKKEGWQGKKLVRNEGTQERMKAMYEERKEGI